jgi:hypothetical protein
MKVNIECDEEDFDKTFEQFLKQLKHKRWKINISS